MVSTASRARSRVSGGAGALTLVWLASAGVIGASLLASFRLGFGDDLPTLLQVNGPRVLFGAGLGGALALSGALRLCAGVDRPLFELEILALSTGAAGAGFGATIGQTGVAALALFVAAAASGAALTWALVRQLDRPRRWTNLAALGLLGIMAGVAALAGTYARARRDPIAPVVTWLLGDLSGASVGSGLAVLALAVALLVVALRALATGARESLATTSLLALGLAVGAGGPLVLVGSMVPLTVRWLADGAAPRALLPASMAAGAATVVAIDAVPRLLVGGYGFPFNVPAAMLAIPIFGGWNRARLRRRAGPASRLFEIVEIALLAGLTVGGAALAAILSGVIRQLT